MDNDLKKRIDHIESRLKKVIQVEDSLKNLLIDLNLIEKGWKFYFIVDFEVIADYLFTDHSLLENSGLKWVFSKPFIATWFFEFIKYITKPSDINSLYNAVLISPYIYEFQNTDFSLRIRIFNEKSIDEKELEEFKKELRNEKSFKGLLDKFREKYLWLYMVFNAVRDFKKYNRKIQSLSQIMFREEELWMDFLSYIKNPDNFEKSGGKKVYETVLKEFNKNRQDKRTSNVVDSFAIAYVAMLNKWLGGENKKELAMILSGAASMHAVLSKNDEFGIADHLKVTTLKIINEITEDDSVNDLIKKYIISEKYDFHNLYRDPSFFLTFLYINYPEEFFNINKKDITGSFMKNIKNWACNTLNEIVYNLTGAEEILESIKNTFKNSIDDEMKKNDYISKKLKLVEDKIKSVEKYTEEMFSLNLLRFQRIFRDSAIFPFEDREDLSDSKREVLEFLENFLRGDLWQDDEFIGKVNRIFVNLQNAYGRLNLDLSNLSPPDSEYWNLLRYQFRRLRGIPWRIKFYDQYIKNELDKFGESFTFAGSDKLHKILKSLAKLKKKSQYSVKKGVGDEVLLNYVLKYMYGEYDDIIYSLNSIIQKKDDKNFRESRLFCEFILIYVLSSLKFITYLGNLKGILQRAMFATILSDLKSLKNLLYNYSENIDSCRDMRIQNLIGVICLKEWKYRTRNNKKEFYEEDIEAISVCEQIFKNLVRRSNIIYLKKDKDIDWIWLIVINNYIYTHILMIEYFLRSFKIQDNEVKDDEVIKDLNELQKYVDLLENYEAKIESENFYEIFETLSRFYCLISKLTGKKESLELAKHKLSVADSILRKNIKLLSKWSIRRIDLQILRSSLKSLNDFKKSIDNICEHT